MAQRVFFFVIGPDSADAWFPQLAANASAGPLELSADAAKRLCDPQFARALTDANLAFCAVGSEFVCAMPQTISGVALAAGQSGWEILPAEDAERIRMIMPSLAGGAGDSSETRLLKAAAQLALNEPWDVFALWLPKLSHVERLAEIIAWQTPDVAICGVSLSEAQSCWFCRLRGVTAHPLPLRPVEDVLPTVLTLAGAIPPPGLPGTPCDFRAAAAPDYSPQDEKEIQKRLEALGYI